MSTPWLMSIVLFALAGAISPGPVNLLATAVGSQAGFVRALPHVSGASLSYVLDGLITRMPTAIFLLSMPGLMVPPNSG